MRLDDFEFDALKKLKPTFIIIRNLTQVKGVTTIERFENALHHQPVLTILDRWSIFVTVDHSAIR